jgi:hypothetical protein
MWDVLRYQEYMDFMLPINLPVSQVFSTGACTACLPQPAAIPLLYKCPLLPRLVYLCAFLAFFDVFYSQHVPMFFDTLHNPSSISKIAFVSIAEACSSNNATSARLGSFLTLFLLFPRNALHLLYDSIDKQYSYQLQRTQLKANRSTNQTLSLHMSLSVHLSLINEEIGPEMKPRI